MQMMNRMLKEDFSEQLGLSEEMLQNAAFTKVDEEGTTHFFPSKTKGNNYKKYCTGGDTKLNKKLLKNKEEIINIVRKYTDSHTLFCTKVNLLLAADSDELKSVSEYVRKLRWCCGFLSNYHAIASTNIQEKEVYRGFDCSEEEFDSYELNKQIFIPSFISTSQSPNKFYANKNCLMIIKFKYIPSSVFVVTGEYSQYTEKEEEILFSCWSKFKVLTKNKNKLFNNKEFQYYIELLFLNDRSFISK